MKTKKLSQLKRKHWTWNFQILPHDFKNAQVYNSNCFFRCTLTRQRWAGSMVFWKEIQFFRISHFLNDLRQNELSKFWLTILKFKLPIKYHLNLKNAKVCKVMRKWNLGRKLRFFVLLHSKQHCGNTFIGDFHLLQKEIAGKQLV